MANVTRKGNPIHTVGELPKVGSPSPDVPSHPRRPQRNISLADFEGKVEILNIVPSLDTGVGAASARARAGSSRPGSTGVRPETARYTHRVQDTVLEQREGLNWIAHPLIGSPTPSPPPVGRGNKLLDSRYFFPSQREGIEGWAREYRKPKRDGYIAILTPGHPC